MTKTASWATEKNITPQATRNENGGGRNCLGKPTRCLPIQLSLRRTSMAGKKQLRHRICLTLCYLWEIGAFVLSRDIVARPIQNEQYSWSATLL